MAQQEHSDSRSGPLPLHVNDITIACHCIAAGTFIRFNSPYALSYFGGNLSCESVRCGDGLLRF